MEPPQTVEPLFEVVVSSLRKPRCIAVNPHSGAMYITDENESGGLLILHSDYHPETNPLAFERIQTIKCIKKNDKGEILSASYDSSVTIRPQMVCLSSDGSTLYFTARHVSKSGLYKMELFDNNKSKRCEQIIETSQIVNGLCLDQNSGSLFLADSELDQIKKVALKTNPKLIYEVESALPDLPFELIDLICDLTHSTGINFTLDKKCPFGICHANKSNLIAFVEMITSTVIIWNHQTNRLIKQWKFDYHFRKNYPSLSTLPAAPMCVGCAFDENDQSIFISDSFNSCILRASIGSGEISIVHDFKVGEKYTYSKPRPTGIQFIPEKSILFVCDSENGLVVKLNTKLFPQNENEKHHLINIDYDSIIQPLENKIKTSRQENDEKPDITGIAGPEIPYTVPARKKPKGIFGRLARAFTCH